jgi:glycerol kinase
MWLAMVKMIDSAEEIETLALKVPDNGGVYFCTCPVWCTTLGSICRGAIRGITRGTTNAHIARAT